LIDFLKWKKRRESFQENWGKPIERNRRLNLIALFYERTPPDFSAINQLDEQTCNDLDFSSVFDIVDHTTSHVGQQYLYAQLLSPTGSTPLIEERAAEVEWVDQYPTERLELQMNLSNLTARNIYYVPLLFADTLPFDKKKYIASEILKWLAIFFTIGAFFDLRFIAGVILLFLCLGTM